MAGATKKSASAMKPINELQPFNKERFDQCMALMANKHGRTLTQYDMVKLHVMTDIFHTLQFGKPVIGGPLSRWPNGPVVKPAYNRVRKWGHDWEQSEAQPESFRIVGKQNKTFHFEPVISVDQDEFSPSELAAMDEAWKCVMSKAWNESQDFFHCSGFVAPAWEKAGANDEPIDWRDVVDEYQKFNPEYKRAEQIKAIISL